jgi:hypothetical protein
MPNYGEIAYWNKRYKEQAGTTYDWLLNYEHFRDIVKNALLRPKLEAFLKEIQKKHKMLAQEREILMAGTQPGVAKGN